MRDPTPRTEAGRPHGALAVAALLATALPAHAEAEEQVERFWGTARDGDGLVLYQEEHVVRRAFGRLLAATTVYTDADGLELARLETDFSRDPFAPAYEFRDARTGEVEAVEPRAGSVVLRAPRGTRTVRIPASTGPRLVSGQGLDRLVRDRLDALAAGEELVVEYAIPSRLDTYEFRIRGQRGGGPDRMRVRVEFTSFVPRLLAPSLEVEYDRTTRRLLRYRGLSNLTGADGANPEVEITYAYPDPSPAEAPRASR
jgi:hypothetical protein